MFKRNFTFTQIWIRIGTIFLLLSSMLSLFYLIDPSDTSWGAGEILFLKYLPVILSLISLVLYLPAIKWWKYLNGELIILLILMLYIIIGSLFSLSYSSYILGESFIGRGLCILPVIPAFLLFKNPQEKEFFVKYSLLFTIISGLLITVALIIWLLGYRFLNLPHIYHEEIFVVVSIGLVLAVTAKKIISWKHFIGLIFILSGVLTQKNTGFLLSLTGIMAYLFIYFLDKTKSKNEIMLARSMVAFSLISIISFISIVLIFFIYLLPSGSPGVRLNTYLARWDMFVESPVFGEFFMGTPIMELPTLYYPIFIPSHSDMLDILAFGGAVGFLLFYFPITKLIINSFIIIRYHFLYVKHDKFYLYSVSVVSGFVILMGFNPVWHQPKLATIFWICVACLLVRTKKNNANA